MKMASTKENIAMHKITSIVAAAALMVFAGLSFTSAPARADTVHIDELGLVVVQIAAADAHGKLKTTADATNAVNSAGIDMSNKVNSNNVTLHQGAFALLQGAAAHAVSSDSNAAADATNIGSSGSIDISNAGANTVNVGQLSAIGAQVSLAGAYAVKGTASAAALNAVNAVSVNIDN